MKLAMGLIPMLVDAIQRHRREHNGELPRRIEMSPVVFEHLKNDCFAMMMAEIISPSEQKFHGVPIVPLKHRTDMVLINLDNEVELI